MVEWHLMEKHMNDKEPNNAFRESKEKPNFVTSRPFEKDKKQYSSEDIQQIEAVYGSWDNAKYALGFTEEEVSDMKKGKRSVLEIGPGTGVSFDQMVRSGVDIYALEPAVGSDFFKLDSKSMRQISDYLIRRDKFSGRVKPNRAGESRSAFPDKKFDVAYAIGPNFQNYSESETELLQEISGILSSLTEKETSYLTFGIDDDESISLGINDTHKNSNFDIKGFLNNRDIEYEVREYFDGESLEPAKAIRIYRKNEDGTDNLTKFN